MTLSINGESKSFADTPPATVHALLTALGLDGKPVLVEHNGTALFPREFESTPVTDGDTIELIQVAAGG